MFGPRINTVFRSRWNALFWSLGVLLTAYCSVPDADDGTPPGQKAAQQIVGKVIGRKADNGHHANPWAKEPERAAPAP